MSRVLGPSAVAAALLASAPTAPANPPFPTALNVIGGVGWHAENNFSLSWASPPPSSPPLVAALYRIRDPHGTTLSEGRQNEPEEGTGGLLVPKVPGTYSAEVWFEDAAGEQGPAATVPLHFDDTRPSAIATGQVPEWIGRTAFPLRVRLGHPSGPLPLSGIRGYAGTVDSNPSGSPCSKPDRCSETETTLAGGAEDDELTIATLPEGTSYLHVVAVSGAGMKSPTSGQAALRVDATDPLTRLSGAPADWTSRPVELTASAVDDGSGMSPGGPGSAPFTAIQVDDGVPAIGLGQSVTTNVISEGAHRIAYYARDVAGNVDDGAGGNGVSNHAPRTAWVRIDRTPPDIGFANSQDPGDPDLIRARVVDPLSGPDPKRGWIGIRLAGSDDPFEPLPRAPAPSGELRAHWESDAHPKGTYELRAIGYDAAGNATATTRRANGMPMVLTNPLKATTKLRAAFRRPGSGRIVPYGRSVLVHGRLTTGLSTALDGRPVRVVERFASGAHPAARVSTVTTGPTGSFSIRTPPGPSRTIELAFGGSPILARSTAQTLQLRVRGRVRLRASAGSAQVGGKPLILSGRIAAPAGTFATDGMPVQLQFRLGHAPWSEFRTVQTDSRGRFRYAYSFSDDDSRGARFQFRAYVPAQESWPYEPAASRPVIVRGT